MNISGKFSLKSISVNWQKLLAGVIYLLLIGVVIYGIGNHVYDGFGHVVPWLIMVVFAIMGVIRIIEGITQREFRSIAAEYYRKFSEKNGKS